jgi:multidrug efflux pump subunit AcrB
MIVVVALFTTLNALFAMCPLSHATKQFPGDHPFWEDYAKLENPNSEKIVAELVQKHQGVQSDAGNEVKDAAQSSTKPSPDNAKVALEKPKSTLVEFKNRKDVDIVLRSQKKLKAKFDEFVNKISEPGGLEEIRLNQNSWNMEKMVWATDKYTVRLNSGYRVGFSYDGKTAKIIIVDKDGGHAHF